MGRTINDLDFERLVMLLGRLERLNDELVASVCAHHDISPSEIRILALLAHADEPAVRPSDLSRAVLQTTGGLTATLGRLEAAGRIERGADPDDGRSKRIRLTPAGRAFHDEVMEELTDRYRLALGDVDVDAAYPQVVALVGAFERLGNHPLSERWAIPTDEP